MNGNLEYQFVLRVCQAIEDYSKQIVAADEQAFIYRGANLQYAVERFLYFRYISDDRLFDYFEQVQQGRLLRKLEFKDNVTRDFARCLFEGDYSPEAIVTNPYVKLLPLNSLPNRVGLQLRRGWQQVERKISARVPAKKGEHLSRAQHDLSAHKPAKDDTLSDGAGSILFYISHEKYVRYLQPILQSLPLQYAYLAQQGAPLATELTERNLPLICFGNPALMDHVGAVGLEEFPFLTKSYDSIFRCLQQDRPRCLIVVEGNHVEDELINRACKQLGIPTLCLQQGWSPIVHNGFRNMSYTKMLVWGQGFAELLQPYNPQQDFVAVGSHVLSNNAQSELLVEEESARTAIAFFLQSPQSPLIGQSRWEELFDLAIWTATQFPAREILVRPHPSRPLSTAESAQLLSYNNVKIVAPEKYALHEVLQASCLSVSIFSSTILESIAVGVFPIVLNTIGLPTYFPDVHSAGAGIEVKSISEAKGTLCSLLKYPEKLDKSQPIFEEFRNRFFHHSSHKDPISCIVNEIVETCT